MSPTLKDRLRHSALKRRSLRQKFSSIYQSGGFGGDGPPSGVGSSLARTVRVRPWLEATLARIGAKVLVDAPCGDFTWMKAVDLEGVIYVGIDVVDDVITENRTRYERRGRTFVAGDLRTAVLPKADLILCRDCLVHLAFRDGLRVLANIRESGARFLAATTFPDLRENLDISTGGWRPLNMSLAPFNLEEPEEMFAENPESDIEDERGKHIGLWCLSKEHDR